MSKSPVPLDLKNNNPGSDKVKSEKIRVVIRCRPLSRKEESDKCYPVVKVRPEVGEVEVVRPSSNNSSTTAPDRKVFVYDASYDSRHTQGKLYEESFLPLINSVLDGINGTIFAYGQTGTGKTWTMQGSLSNPEEHGVIPNAFKSIFNHIEKSPQKRYLVRASYLEIYQEEIRDLLHREKKPRELKEGADGPYVKELSSYLCSNFQEINDLMAKGNKNRAVGATNMNEHSSRSHAIFTITIEVSEELKGTSHIRVGKLNLVDLAGSERQSKSGATGNRLKEATKINLSLSALGNVINALQDGKSTHIPYRDSKLTRILQDSLGGNARTVMVATIGPADYNWDETMTTLRYASRAKRIKNRPKVNEDPKDAMLREYQEEIARLREQLAQKRLFFHGEPGEATRVKTRVGTARAGSSGRQSKGLSSVPIGDSRLKELRALLEPYGLDPNEEDPIEILALLEERKQSLLEDDATVEEEKESLLGRLNELQASLQNSESECDTLSERIRWLESKVLNGGKSLVDHTNEQQKILEQRQLELRRQQQREELVRRKLEEHELTTAEMRSALSATQADFETKSKKLRKLCHRLNGARAEFQRMQEEFREKRDEVEEDQVQVKRDLKLMRTIIDHFVPPSIRKLTESRILTDGKDGDPLLQPGQGNTLKRPSVHRPTPLPTFNRGLETRPLVHSTDRVHFREQNILQLHPEPPTSSVKAFTQAGTDPFLKALLDKAFADVEQEAVIDCRKITKQQKGRHGGSGPGDYLSRGGGGGRGDYEECTGREVAREVRRWTSGGIEFRDLAIVRPSPTKTKHKNNKYSSPSSSSS